MELENEQVLYSSEKCVIVKGDYNGFQCVKKTGGFSREAALAAARINSPYIPKIYEIGENYIISEFVDGIDLSKAKISPKSVRNIALELCGALEILHKNNVIHRDVKPSNIILCGDGHIKLTDFDAARVKKTETDKDTVFIGTDGFAPPEQFGFTQTDERSDIYAFGVTIKLLLGKNYTRSAYRGVIEKCMRFDPGKRYSSIKSVRFAIIGSRFLPIAIPCIAAVAAVAVIAVAMRAPTGITAAPSDNSGTEHSDYFTQSTGSGKFSENSTDAPAFFNPIPVPEDRSVAWELLALPSGFPKLTDGVLNFDYYKEYYGAPCFEICWLEMSDEEFLEIESKIKNWLKISEDGEASEYMDGEKREFSNGNYTVCIYKYRSYVNQNAWSCQLSAENIGSSEVDVRLDLGFADPHAEELGARPVRWEDAEIGGIIPKLAENVTDAGIKWGDRYYAEWEKMSLGEVGCVLRIIADKLNAELTRQHLDGGENYQWTFRTEIDGELKYIQVDYNFENQFSVLLNEPQMSVSVQ
ncbi:MAG: serine/threonine protein kinase [Ruminococcus sp.]|nr:serine/threonine protein kinase [Ruminococcus sp.]